MTLVPPSIIKIYAETIGIANLSEDVLNGLAQDVEYRARELIQEAGKYMVHGKRQRLSLDDINMALQAKNVEPLYGYDPTEPLNFRSVPNSTLFYVPNDEIDLETLLQEPPPKAPLPITVTSHWLVIEGVQPSIPENPVVADRSILGTDDSVALLGPTPRKDVLEDVETKANIKHILSRELQLYYDAIVSDLLSDDLRKTDVALNAVESDAGIQQLLPYFIQFVAEMVPKNLRILGRLEVMMRLCRALLANKHLFVEPYLHQLMPPVLTCLLGKRLCEDPGEEPHWSLRRSAAEIVAYVCQTFGDAYATLVPRVTRTMIKTLLDADKPLPSHYGAIVGLTALGPNTIDSLLIPIIESYVRALRPDTSNVEPALRNEIGQVYNVLVDAAKAWISANPDRADPQTERKYSILRNIFGSDLD